MDTADTLTSLAYLAAGVFVAARSHAFGRARRLRALALGSTIALNGVGSFAYHGWPAPGTNWLHDVALVAVLGALIAIDLGRFRDWSEEKVVSLLAGLTAAGGAVLVVTPDGTNVLTAALAGVAVSFEVVTAVRAHRAGGTAFPRRPALWVAGAALVAASLGNVAGRLGLLQGHGVWHVGGAVFMAAFAVVVLDRPDGLVHRGASGS